MKEMNGNSKETSHRRPKMSFKGEEVISTTKEQREAGGKWNKDLASSRSPGALVSVGSVSFVMPLKPPSVGWGESADFQKDFFKKLSREEKPRE